MKGIIKFFIQNPTLVNLALILILGIGALRLMQTKSTNFPKQKIRFISIVVPYPGASPTEVEEGISVKIEENLVDVQGIDRVSSKSSENVATLSVELEEYADSDVVLAAVKNAVDKINTFPDRAESPSIEKVDKMDMTMSFGILGDLTLGNMNDLAESIQDDLLQINGISKVFVEGVPQEEIEISLRENDLRTFNLSFEEVVRAVQMANLNSFGGEIKSTNSNIKIKTENQGYYGKDLRDIVVRATPDGNTIYLWQIADINDQFADEATAKYFEGKPIVTVSVYSLPEEDILVNAEAVRAYVEEFNRSRSGIQLKVFEDGTKNLKERLGTMVNNGIVGVLLVLIVLALFLDRYLAFWVALKIPIAILGMFIVAEIYGMTINVVSLFGFILVLGILVDDGVVIGENIYQWAKEKGYSASHAALKGTLEMIVPVIISLTTTCVAFSLFFFLPTQAGEFFGEMAFVVIAVLFFAMVESFFFLPAHLAHSKGLKSGYKPTKLEKAFNHSLVWVRDKLYLPTFKIAVLKYKWVTLILFIAFLGGSISIVSSGLVGITFFPNLDDDAVFIELEMQPGTPKEVTKASLDKIEAAVWKTNQSYSESRVDGEQVVRYVEVITGPQANQGRLKVTFLGGEQRGVSSFELNRSFRENTPEIAKVVSLQYGLGATTAVFGKPVSFSLRSKNLAELREAKNALKAVMQQNADLKDVTDNDQIGSEELQLKLLPQAELLSINLNMVMAQVRAAFFGIEIQSLQREDKEVKIWVRYPRSERTQTEDLMDMRIQTPQGTYPLSEIASVDAKIGELAINHLSGGREITVAANVASLDVSAPKVINTIQNEILPKISAKYPSVSYTIEGQNRQSFKLAGAVQTVGPIIILFIIALIVINFSSFSQAAVVFLLFPFAVIGVILGHWMNDVTLSLFSGIGTIALLGVFVNDSLVFISTFNNKLANGATFKDAISETAQSRFRPILLTTVTTVAGLGPLIFSSSLGAQFLKGPAVSIAFGLAFGLFTILFLLPSFLVMLNGWRVNKQKYLLRKPKSAEAVEPAVRQLAHQMEEESLTSK